MLTHKLNSVEFDERRGCWCTKISTFSSTGIEMCELDGPLNGIEREDSAGAHAAAERALELVRTTGKFPNFCGLVSEWHG